jgi:short-subunit dehydrogenase
MIKYFMKQSAYSFNGKIVVITGGSSGIGKQLAKDLLCLGACVIICSNDEEGLMKAASDLKVFGKEVNSFYCDVRDESQVHQLSEFVLNLYGGIDILVNNAGYAVYRSFEESSLEEVLDIVNVNLCGAMRCTKYFLPTMIKQRQGRIVNISSIGGEIIITPNATYCGAKHGLVAWTKAIRYELAHFNISANVICPSHTKTNFHNDPSFQRRKLYQNKNIHSLTTAVVSARILDSIRHDRVVDYVPSWNRLAVWANNAFPFIMRPLLDILMSKRINQLYDQIRIENIKKG